MTAKLSALITRNAAATSLPSAAEIASERLAPLAFSALAGQDAHRALRAELRPYVIRATATDLTQTKALLELRSLASDLDVLVIKGAANGPLLYSDSAMRPRADIDVWLDGWTSARALADRLLDAGYREVHQLPGRLSRHAIALRRGAGEYVDVHATCSRRVRVARAMPFRQAWAKRQRFEVEGDAMSTLSAEDAWFLGAVHLSAHHGDQHPPRVLFEDLRRLAARLDEGAWARIWETSTTHGLVSALRVAVDGLASWSAGSLPRGFVDAVGAAPADESERFAQPLGAALDDLALLEADEALVYLRELLYPPADYLHAHYGLAADRPRSLLAGHRLLRVVARIATRGHNRGV